MESTGENDRLQHWPKEDIVWEVTVEECESDSDSDNESSIADEATIGAASKMAIIKDTRHSFIGAGTLPTDVAAWKDSLIDLIVACAKTPLSGRPRKPCYLRLGEGVAVADESLKSSLASLDIELITVSPPCPCHTPSPPFRSCSVCRRRGSESLFFLCPQCQAVYYCSETCQQSDLDLQMTSLPQGHQAWCDKMKEYLAMDEVLADLPFTFMRETSDADFDKWRLQEFLEMRNLMGKGFWQLECSVQCERLQAPHGEIPIDEEFNPYILEEGLALIGLPQLSGFPLLSPPPPLPSTPLLTWEDYYDWRGFDLGSPLAALLHWPLTMYHIVVNCWPTDYPEDAALVKVSQSILVHLVGVAKEVDLVPTFFELSHLLPDMEINIVMIGVDFSKKSHGKVVQKDKVRVAIHHGMYHKYCGERSPDIVIGFNAGLAAYKSWTKTLKKLQKEKTPAYFTDYCQYSCEVSRAPIEAQGDGRMSDICINPFRGPFRKRCEEHRMPWYPNAFIFFLIHH